MERAIVLEQVAAWFGARSRDRREIAAVRKGGYWICGVFPHIFWCGYSSLAACL